MEGPGLRTGKVSHMRHNQIDPERGWIEILAHDPCDHGHGGSVCGYCRSQAKTGNTLSTGRTNARRRTSVLLKNRSVIYNCNDSLFALFDVFFHRHERFPWCRSAFNRWVNDLAEESDFIEDKDEIYPHAFRGHAARRFARKGMRAHTLRRHMGWGSVEAALDYIRMEADDIEDVLSRIFDSNGKY